MSGSNRRTRSSSVAGPIHRWLPPSQATQPSPSPYTPGDCSVSPYGAGRGGAPATSGRNRYRSGRPLKKVTSPLASSGTICELGVGRSRSADRGTDNMACGPSPCAVTSSARATLTGWSCGQCRTAMVASCARSPASAAPRLSGSSTEECSRMAGPGPVGANTRELIGPGAMPPSCSRTPPTARWSRRFSGNPLAITTSGASADGAAGRTTCC
ncbi:hypothetical protein [Micromonospora sp. NPDC048830]|uniref:hypothetical protein n=1 Tax=Micromonospora sp. NPDC048830 TaxID=3364257 RepID=UPI00371AF5C5